MGIAMNPNLPVLIIRDGSLLDDESRRIIADMAEAAHAQVWMEVVADTCHECRGTGYTGDASVIIEDGEVYTP